MTMGDMQKNEDTTTLTMDQLLEKKFVYQNNTTGSVSSLPMTTRQLCRLLCPARGVVLSHISPETQVLGVNNQDDGSYDSGGWKTARTVPVFQEACAQWYSCALQDGSQQGPHSCRELSEMIHNETITRETEVWSSHMSTWEAISDLPHLLAAVEAFVHAHPHGDSNPIMNASSDDKNAAIMTFEQTASTDSKDVQDELEAFLSSTAHLGPQHNGDDDDDDGDNVEGYTSDGGTPYVKDVTTGNWIHADLAPPVPSRKVSTKVTNNKKKDLSNTTKQTTTRKRKKPKFSAKNAKCWVYVQGLPLDTNEQELEEFCAKVGIIELDPETQRPKVKLYRHKNDPGGLKGDASICYARPESVELALQLLDEAPYRPSVNVNEYKISVTRAKFEQHGDKFVEKKVSNAKRKVAKLAALQAIGWDEGDNGRITGGRKGLRIIVLKHLFTLEELKDNEDKSLHKLEHDVRQECEQWGTVEKITVFSKHAEGVVIVKFTQPTAASTAVKEFHGRKHNGRQIECTFWDGVTDYTVRDEEKEQTEAAKRQEDFGQWLDNQDLPEELRLNTE